MVRPLLRAWRRIFSTRVAREIDDELRFHLEMRTQEYERTGIAARAAHRRALRRFGSVETIRNACRTVYGIRRSARPRRGQLMDNLWQDIQYGIRSLARQPSFTLIAIGTLAIGIGANTVIYSAVNSTLLHPFPYEGSDRFVHIQHASPTGTMWVGPPSVAIHAWRERAGTLEDLATYGWEPIVIRMRDELIPMTAVAASIDLLPFLRIAPIAGRGFAPQDTVPGYDRVVLLTDRLQRRWYPREPDVLGRTITVNGEPHTIVGILPDRTEALFGRSTGESAMDFALWLPGANRHSNFARLRAGVAIDDALAELQDIHARLGLDAGRAEGWAPVLHRPSDYFADDLALGLWMLLGTVSLVLLLACINVLNMLLVRGIGRAREIGIRVAVGAGRARIFRQLFIEGILLTTAAAIAAVGLGALAIQTIQPLLPEGLAALQLIRMDPRVVAVIAVIAMVTSVVFGLVPLAQLRTDHVNTLLRPGVRAGLNTPNAGRARGLLVAFQVALATVLFVGAGLMTNSLIRLSDHDLAFDPKNLLSFSVSLPENRYSERTDRVAFYEAALNAIRAIPAARVAAVGGIIGYGYMEGELKIEGHSESAPRRGMVLSIVSDGYFRTLSLPLLEGREFTLQDIRGIRGPVIINENFARLYWPDRSAIDARFQFDKSDRWYTVAGVAPNVELSGLHADPTSLTMYQPYTMMATAGLPFTVRITGTPSNVIALLKGAMWTVDPDLPLRNIEIAEDTVAAANARPRFNAIMLVGFALIGLTLAVVGVYSVVSLALEHRAHELGIRVALGAAPSDGVRLMLWQGLAPVAIGIGVGLVGAVALSRLLRSLLFEVHPLDPGTYAVVLAALMTTAFAACYLPARRATRVDPVEVLRVQ